MEPENIEGERRQIIQLAAYYLWQQRGCPFGTPEIDWFQAEEQLRDGNDETSSKPALVTVAEAIGSALGSVTGHVASVVSLVRSDENAGAEQTHADGDEAERTYS